MKKVVLSALIIGIGLLCALKCDAQSLPTGACGIVYTYDESGNRTKREYVCNNGLMAVQNASINDETVASDDIFKVDVLYPNPTTGIFSIRFFKSLNKATVTINDISGRIIVRKTESGNILNYDLSDQPSGQYIVTIKQNTQKISIKVIKEK